MYFRENTLAPTTGFQTAQMAEVFDTAAHLEPLVALGSSPF